MIARLRGTVIEQLDDMLVVDVRGVGYAVRVSGEVLGQYSLRSNAEIDLLVHTEVRENDISLYGFATPLERRVFLLLQRVRGIGAKLSLQLVSAIGAESLLATIGQGSVTALCAVPGVGKKTAERILVELRELVTEMLTEVSESRGPLHTQVQVSHVTADAMTALERLGFSSERARLAVAAAAEELGADTGKDSAQSLERLLHVALQKAAN